MAAIFQSCFYDKLNELHPSATDPCDTTLAPAFNTSINLIVRSNCVSCHSGSSPSGGISLENYGDVVGIANTGKLLGSITGDGSAVAMPPDTKIRACEIGKIETWIQNGLPEN